MVVSIITGCPVRCLQRMCCPPWLVAHLICLLSTEKIAGAGEATRRPHGARPGRHDVQTVEDGFYP